MIMEVFKFSKNCKIPRKGIHIGLHIVAKASQENPGKESLNSDRFTDRLLNYP